jgi:hypothetical protein
VNISNDETVRSSRLLLIDQFMPLPNKIRLDSYWGLHNTLITAPNTLMKDYHSGCPAIELLARNPEAKSPGLPYSRD